MNDQNRRDVTPDDFHDLDGVPTYSSGSTAANAGRPDIYQRTGKAAPTEVFPSGAAGATGSTAANPGTHRGAEWVETARPTPAQSAQAPQTASAETVSLPRDASDPVTETTTQRVSGTSTSPGFYTASHAPAVVEPDPTAASTDFDTDTGSATVAEPRARRGTIDLGLFLLRVLVGGYLTLDAIKTFFRLGGSEGIAGLESAFGSYAFGDILSVVLPTLELAAGVFLVLGLLTPVAAMIAVAVTGFLAVHAVAESGDRLDVLSWDANVWLPLLLLGASLALQFTGPGFYAVDAGRSWARRPLASSWIFAILGIAAAVLLWWFGAAVNPLG